ncbi:hypothetical protein DICSQDRAFT_177075 [Dichomitus squalens LYAD-421 SS1]|uniref:uncharacterized protein n=1 Tax=Dichomitus squalens (strain LYAD-421) TaxID=732165 RepID=UPI00044129B4|nr:uncharacterized protein DICSQDRAFT_177075 [Dichomitus squalens LYAD-421 SS1]EJF67470.1 hypothetical protein DICSQDRAFT_177075 [Dichomitus squalens LYAD-421 SS1]
MYKRKFEDILGAADMGDIYVTIFLVLATALTISYAFFMSSNRFRLVPSLLSPSPTQKAPQTRRNSEADIVDEIDSPRLVISAVVNSSDRTSATEIADVFALGKPVVDHQTSVAASDDVHRREVIGDPSALSETTATPTTSDDGEAAVAISEAYGTAKRVSDALLTDNDVAGSPVNKPSDVQLGDFKFPEMSDHEDDQGAARPIAEPIPDDGPSSQHREEPPHGLFMEGTPLTVPSEAVAESVSLDPPFLLAAHSNDAPRERPCSEPGDDVDPCETTASAFMPVAVDKPHDLGLLGLRDFEPTATSISEASEPGTDPLLASYVLQTSLLSPGAGTAGDLDSTSETIIGLDADDDWTSVALEESHTPRPSWPVEIRKGPSPIVQTAAPEHAEQDHIAASAVLLSRSHWASAILVPAATDIVDGDLPSPPSSVSSGRSRPRVHTPERPDWAVAPQDEHADAHDERQQRRHSLDNPDWAVAPDVPTTGKKKGRRSDPGSSSTGSGARKRSRRGRSSR